MSRARDHRPHEHSLLAHRSDAPGPVRELAAAAGLEAGGVLALGFRMVGEGVRLPSSAAPERSDGLWRHTCFEAFARPAGAAAYHEFNFAPSGAWAAYGFGAYREGMRPLEGPVPAASWLRRDGHLTLEARIPAELLPPCPPGTPLQVALAAVVEDGSGTMTYWALRHPPGRPDFHHPDGFALELARH